LSAVVSRGLIDRQERGAVVLSVFSGNVAGPAISSPRWSEVPPRRLGGCTKGETKRFLPAPGAGVPSLRPLGADLKTLKKIVRHGVVVSVLRPRSAPQMEYEGFEGRLLNLASNGIQNCSRIWHRWHSDRSWTASIFRVGSLLRVAVGLHHGRPIVASAHLLPPLASKGLL
jgi:hypothetical protein